MILFAGQNSHIFGGKGDDAIFISDNGDASAANNYVYGEAGNDFINAAFAGGVNRLFAGSGNDLLVGGSGNDWLYGTSGINILIGLEGADHIFAGTGRDLLVASRTTNMANIESLSDGELQAFFEELCDAWMVNDDLAETIDLLGAASVADGSQDRLYRSGKRNLFYTNSEADEDWENAFEDRPFFDTLIDS